MFSSSSPSRLDLKDNWLMRPLKSSPFTFTADKNLCIANFAIKLSAAAFLKMRIPLWHWPEWPQPIYSAPTWLNYEDSEIQNWNWHLLFRCEGILQFLGEREMWILILFAQIKVLFRILQGSVQLYQRITFRSKMKK